MTTTYDATERDWLTSVRQARADLMSVPAMPIAPVTLGDLYGYYKCAGCGQPCAPRAFEDAAGYLWCCQCVTSDAIGAAFTQAELIQLSGTLCSAVDRCERGAAVHRFADAEAGRRSDMLAEIRDLRDAVTLAPIGGPVPVRALFGEVSS